MASKGVNPVLILRSIYNDEFQWSVVKSFAVFLFGIRLAKELVGVEIMPAITAV